MPLYRRHLPPPVITSTPCPYTYTDWQGHVITKTKLVKTTEVVTVYGSDSAYIGTSTAFYTYGGPVAPPASSSGVNGGTGNGNDGAGAGGSSASLAGSGYSTGSDGVVYSTGVNGVILSGSNAASGTVGSGASLTGPGISGGTDFLSATDSLGSFINPSSTGFNPAATANSGSLSYPSGTEANPSSTAGSNDPAVTTNGSTSTQSTSNSPLSPGGLAGVIIGSIVGGLLLLLLLCCLCFRFRRRSTNGLPQWDWVMVDSPKEPLVETVFNGDEPKYELPAVEPAQA